MAYRYFAVDVGDKRVGLAVSDALGITAQGIYIYNLETDKYIHLTTSESDDRYALSDNAIYTIFKDREGGMWIGSYFGGVNYYPHQYTYFEKYYPRDDMRYLGHRIREFCGSNDGTIWFGTEDKGLFHFNPADGTVTPFRHPALYHNIHGLCIDGDYLWVGTFSGGLNRIHLRTREVRHYEKARRPIPSTPTTYSQSIKAAPANYG